MSVAHRRAMSCVGGISLITDRILYGLFHTLFSVERTAELSTSGVHWLVGGMLP